MSCDPRLLRSFVALADELHFGRAAERLHVAQPALSQQIARLERQVGVTLFARTRRTVELTEAGTAMLAPARTAVQAAHAADEVARAHARGERGELRLGLSPGVHYLAQGLLADFGRARPGVRVRAQQDGTGALARQVASGDLELALGCCAQPVQGVLVERLHDEPIVVAVAISHPLAQRAVVALEDLADEPFALVDDADGPGYNRAVRDICGRAGFTPRTAADSHGPMAWETAVRAAGCVGLTTRWSAVSSARDVHLLELDPPTRLAAELLLPEGSSAVLRPAAHAFAALARATVKAS
jgi:DNA-binding transcriptional LysR family regulator